MKCVFFRWLNPSWTKCKLIKLTHLLHILSHAPGEPPSAEPTDQGALIPLRRQVNCQILILLSALTGSEKTIFVVLLLWVSLLFFLFSLVCFCFTLNQQCRYSLLSVKWMTWRFFKKAKNNWKPLQNITNDTGQEINNLEKKLVNFNQLIMTSKMVLWWYLSVSADAAFYIQSRWLLQSCHTSNIEIFVLSVFFTYCVCAQYVYVSFCPTENNCLQPWD